MTSCCLLKLLARAIQPGLMPHSFPPGRLPDHASVALLGTSLPQETLASSMSPPAAGLAGLGPAAETLLVPVAEAVTAASPSPATTSPTAASPAPTSGAEPTTGRRLTQVRTRAPLLSCPCEPHAAVAAVAAFGLDNQCAGRMPGVGMEGQPSCAAGDAGRS